MLFVLKSFINSLLYVKSNEGRSALRKLQHSNPYNSIGKHLDLTILESPTKASVYDLFALYLDDLASVCDLNQSCSIFLYVDDIILIAPTVSLCQN